MLYQATGEGLGQSSKAEQGWNSLQHTLTCQHFLALPHLPLSMIWDMAAQKTTSP